jgi:hypothetical protein
LASIGETGGMTGSFIGPVLRGEPGMGLPDVRVQKSEIEHGADVAGARGAFQVCLSRT